SLALADDSLKVTTCFGAEWSLPLNAIAAIDYESVHVKWLGEFDFDEVQVEPKIDVPSLSIVKESLQPRRNVGFSGEPLQLGQKSFERGITLATRSSVAYRLGGKFRRLTGLVGIDEAARAAGGKVRCEVRGDDKTLWTKDIKAGDAPVAIDLPISGVRKLWIVA